MTKDKLFFIVIVVLALLAIALTFLVSPSTVSAQLDPGYNGIFQNGNEVGNIFVPNHNPEACTYMEYWYLFESYQYPGQQNPVSTTIETVKSEITDLQTFQFQMEQEHPDGYMVAVKSVEMRPDCN